MHKDLFYNLKDPKSYIISYPQQNNDTHNKPPHCTSKSEKNPNLGSRLFFYENKPSEMKLFKGSRSLFKKFRFFKNWCKIDFPAHESIPTAWELNIGLDSLKKQPLVKFVSKKNSTLKSLAKKTLVESIFVII